MFWICNKCGQNNSEDFCAKCGTSREESFSIGVQANKNAPSKKTKVIIIALISAIVCLLGGIFATFYFLSAPNTYTVSFDANGGINPPTAQTVEEGGKVTEPAATPTREGYEFDGWSIKKDGNSHFDFSAYTVEKDITLYAFWKKVEEVNTEEETEEKEEEKTEKKPEEAKVTVPNVIGYEGKPAYNTVEGSGFRVNLVEDSSSYSGTGYSTVYKQSPAAGSKAKKGSTVTLYLKFHPTDNSNNYEENYDTNYDNYYDESYYNYYDSEYYYDGY